MEEKEIQRSSIIEIDEFKTEIAQVINKAIQVRKIPCYIIDMVLLNFDMQVKENARNELIMERKRISGLEAAQTIQND